MSQFTKGGKYLAKRCVIINDNKKNKSLGALNHGRTAGRGGVKLRESAARFPSGAPRVLTGAVVDEVDGVPPGSSPAIMRYYYLTAPSWRGTDTESTV